MLVGVTLLLLFSRLDIIYNVYKHKKHELLLDFGLIVSRLKSSAFLNYSHSVGRVGAG